MATWVLNCKNCGEAFPYCLLPDVLACPRSLPAFPPKGETTQVPPLQNKVYLPAMRPEISERALESSSPISASAFPRVLWWRFEQTFSVFLCKG